MATKVDISTRFLGDEGDLLRSIEKVNKKMEMQGKTLRRSRRDWRQFQQNAIFGVEDVAATLGTGGLSGAVRAASNNITMMTMAIGGPWMVAITVAGMALLQLALALDLFGEKADKSAEKLKKVGDDYRNALRAGMSMQEKMHAFNKKIMEGSLQERESARAGLVEEIETQKAVLGYLKKNLALREKALKARLAEAKASKNSAERTVVTGAAAKGRKAAQEGFAKRKSQQAEEEKARIKAAEAEIATVEATLAELAKMDRYSQQQMRFDKNKKEQEEREKQRKEEILELVGFIAKKEEYRNSLKGKTKGQLQDEIEAERDKIKLYEKQMQVLQSAPGFVDTEEEEIGLAKQREIAEMKIAEAKEAQKNAAVDALKTQVEMNRALEGSIKGSKEFARAFQKIDKPSMEDLAAGGEQGADIKPFGGRYKEKSHFGGKFREEAPIDKWARARDAKEKKEAPIEKWARARDAKEKKEAPIEKWLRERDKDAKNTADNTKKTNELLSRISDNLGSGPTLDVTVGGILS